MSSFINSIVNRAIESKQMINPRLPGKFERDTKSSFAFISDDSSETFHNNKLPHTFSGDSSGNESKTPGVSSAFATLSVESVKPKILADPVKRSVSQPPLISKIDSKENDKDQKWLPLTPENEVFLSQPVSDIFFIQNESGDKQADKLANPRSNRRKNNGDLKSVQPVEEIYSSSKSESHISVMENILQQELPPSWVLPAVLPFKELYDAPSILNAGVNFNTLLKDDHKMRSASIIGQSSAEIENTQTINISIGRVEVKVSQPPVQAPSKPKMEGIAIMSLDEYLDKRNQGSR